MAGMRERLAHARDIAETRLGVSVTTASRLDLLEAQAQEAGALRRELDALAWTALNYDQNRPQELRVEERRKLVQKARVVWMKDPQAGAAVELMNDFVFGGGLPKPKANDELVQSIIDEAWSDPDNEETLTSLGAQDALGIDLELQSNLFFLVFDDGDDGKVKLAFLEHDNVITTVRDPKYRRRVLYYVCEEPLDEEVEWDYDLDMPVMADKVKRTTTFGPPTKEQARQGRYGRRIVYYEHWRNVEQAMKDADSGVRDKPRVPPPEKTGDGKVFHIAINRAGEMAFGHPRFDRLIGWYNAYNRFMDARVDIMEAKAAFVMKRKIKGSPTQLRKQATQAISRRSGLGLSVDPVTGDERQIGPKPASILAENESETWEDMKLDTGAGNAAQDAQMLRAQISAATRWPQSYYGDATNANLATATSLELPVLKGVEKRQKYIERLVRFFIDRVIERAVDAGRIPTDLTDEERTELERKKDPQRQNGAPPLGPLGLNGMTGMQPQPLAMQQAHEDAEVDEAATERDLGYEFKMPNPLKRMLADLISAIGTIAQTFDPNNTNVELSRTLLAVALGEGLELEDPAAAVEKIFPEGYVDPAQAAAQAAMANGQMPPAPPGPYGEFAPPQPGHPGADGQRHPAGNPYGAPQRSRAPEDVRLTEAWWPRGRSGAPVNPVALLEAARARELPDRVRARAAVRAAEVDDEFEQTVAAALGNGNGRH